MRNHGFYLQLVELVIADLLADLSWFLCHCWYSGYLLIELLELVIASLVQTFGFFDFFKVFE